MKRGDMVSLMYSRDIGKITDIRGDIVSVEVEGGLVIPLHHTEIVPLFNDQMTALSEEMPKNKERSGVRFADSGNKSAECGGSVVEVDLHVRSLGGRVDRGNELSSQLGRFRQVMAESIRHRGRRIIFIHGEGEGVLKSAIWRELDSVYAGRCTWSNAPFGKYLNAATVVIIK